jgi:hypothetical protein
VASEILPGWLVDTHRLHVFPLLWFARVTRGSVVQRHVFGVTQRQAFRRGCRWLLVNHCSCRDAGPEETP